MDPSLSHFYDRQIKLDSVGVTGQQKLLDSKVLVIGSGGLGCSAIDALARAGVGSLTIVDFDKVDVTNLHRQALFNRNDINKYKVDIAKEKVFEVAPWIDVEAIPQKFDFSNLDNIFENHDLILDCTDNLKTKFLIHDFAYEKQVNLVQSSIHKFDGQLQVFKYAESRDKGCLRCLWQEQPEQIGDCNDNGVLGVVPMLFGMLQATEGLKLLLDLAEDSDFNQLKTFNLINFELTKLQYPKDDNCNFCVKHKRKASMKFYEVDPTKINFADYTWIDIRVASKEGVLPASIPADQILVKSEAEVMGEIPDYPQDKPFLILCDKGFRASGLAKLLGEFGNKNVFSLVGGFEAIKDM